MYLSLISASETQHIEHVITNKHFSHVTKSYFFKNVNLRGKANRNFRGNLLKNHFRELKLFSDPPSWLTRNRCRTSAFWKMFQSKSVPVHCCLESRKLIPSQHCTRLKSRLKHIGISRFSCESISVRYDPALH